MSIYTKKGDEGETRLYSGNKRVAKDSLRICAVGAVDELNSYLGIVISGCCVLSLVKILQEIQKDLLTLGSIIGGSNLRFSKTKVRKVEREIDKLEKELPKLTNFVVPGGAEMSAGLHFARTLARRAEREVVALYNKEVLAGNQSSSGRKTQILIYLNRLSDALFMFARKANFEKGIKEHTWKVRR